MSTTDIEKKLWERQQSEIDEWKKWLRQGYGCNRNMLLSKFDEYVRDLCRNKCTTYRDQQIWQITYLIENTMRENTEEYRLVLKNDLEKRAKNRIRAYMYAEEIVYTFKNYQ